MTLLNILLLVTITAARAVQPSFLESISKPHTSLSNDPQDQLEYMRLGKLLYAENSMIDIAAITAIIAGKSRKDMDVLANNCI
jgi:hypothetical protein